MDLGHYILDGHTPVHIPIDLSDPPEVWQAAMDRWGRWREEHRAEMVVARTEIGDYEIATDFLGMEMGLWRRVPGQAPLLFETMVFSGFRRKGATGQMERCSTWEEAEAQHARVVAAVQRMVNG